MELKTGTEILKKFNQQDVNMETYLTLEEMIDQELEKAKSLMPPQPGAKQQGLSAGNAGYNFLVEEEPTLEKITDLYIYNKFDLAVKTNKGNWYVYNGGYNDIAIGVTDFHFKIVIDEKTKNEFEILAKKL